MSANDTITAWPKRKVKAIFLNTNLKSVGPTVKERLGHLGES
jgi:hypothetical protein